MAKKTTKKTTPDATSDFNQVEQDYITNNKNLPPATLAKALGTTVSKISTFLKTLPASASNFENVIGKHKDKNNKPRATVMTPAASQTTDFNKPKKLIDPTCVHQCRKK